MNAVRRVHLSPAGALSAISNVAIHMALDDVWILLDGGFHNMRSSSPDNVLGRRRARWSKALVATTLAATLVALRVGVGTPTERIPARQPRT